MNFYNPYYYAIPSTLTQPKIGILGRLFGSTGVSISNFLNGTQRVLNIANQAIPLVKQVKPMIGNAKTMFRVMNEFKRVERSVINNNNLNNQKTFKNYIENDKIIENNITEGPTFFA